MRRSTIIVIGLVPIVTFYSSIALAILFSPWFSWVNDALSDLGHATRSAAAPIFNFGLVLTGALIIIFSVLFIYRHAKWTACSFVIMGFSMQLVGAFNETYGPLHSFVSVLLFLSLLACSLVYFAEKRCYLALITPLAAIAWVMYFQGIFFEGVALPEIISSFAFLPCYLVVLRNTSFIADDSMASCPAN
jgi:hypothetical membrane protein